MAEIPGRIKCSPLCLMTLDNWLCLSGLPLAQPTMRTICCCNVLCTRVGQCADFLSGSSLQEPGLFEPEVVMAQLRYSGVLETVRIRKEGFPVRLPFQMFIDRYLSQNSS